jgi:hypothetical protein
MLDSLHQREQLRRELPRELVESHMGARAWCRREALSVEDDAKIARHDKAEITVISDIRSRKVNPSCGNKKKISFYSV